ncbi:hypothetical protein EV200_101351 [Pedobacter psychrotolerans]|nr:hypothetical protein [Pedobacter psychrotolerans]TCO30910.1 hypothetical protein EV200_101351 [Pedobacter psychrotolerans]
MENDKIANENKNEHPKPTDEVQKEIETVVPTAHKEEVTPGEPENQNEVKEDQSTDESEDNDAEKVTEGEGTDQSEEKPSASTESETNQEADIEEDTDDEGKEGSDNEHNGIETVTP